MACILFMLSYVPWAKTMSVATATASAAGAASAKTSAAGAVPESPSSNATPNVRAAASKLCTTPE